jgi:fatty-acyl-CoA synthase
MPKGVMWRQDDLVRGVIGATSRHFRQPVDWEATRQRITRAGRVGLPACPLMHGTGWFAALAVLSTAGCVVTLPDRHFEAERLLDALDHHRVNTAAIVGDTFGRPMLRALDAEPQRWDLSPLMALTSSGVMWSAPVKQGLLRHLPHVRLIDNFGSSEAMGMGQSVSTADDNAGPTAKFALSANTRVIDETNRDVVPGSGTVGRVAVRGHQPIGYYKDPVKSAATFVLIDGERYSIPGDYASVEADGTLVLLGRGSVCINTGGEKVFPEEVEEVVKLHPSVRDAVVVGVPDERFGESITALVELHDGKQFDEKAVIDTVKNKLAHYKAPKKVIQITSIDRGPNAKVDYRRLRQRAIDALGVAPA